MNEDAFILDAWRFTGKKPVKIDSVTSYEEGCWYHCRRDKEGLAQWLGDIGIQESLVDILVADDTRSHYQPLDDGNFLLVLRGVNLNEGDEPDDMISLRIVFYKSSVITLRRKPFKGIAAIQHALEEETSPKPIADLLATFIEQINNNIEDVLDDIETGIDEVEENIDNLTRKEHRQLTLMHRRLLKLNRFLKPQTVAIQTLYDNIPPVLKSHKQRLLNQKEVSYRISENIEANLMQVSMLRNDIQQSLGEKMNRNAYYLSLTAGIFLPLSFCTGLFGINIGGLPGVDNPDAFRWFCMTLLSLGLIGFLLLRRLRFW